MDLISAWFQTGALLLASVFLLWLLSLRLRDAGIIDSFWGLGFVLSVWAYFVWLPGGLAERKWLLAALVSMWGLRLSAHITWRNWRRGEDFRYASWRKEHGRRWPWRSLWQVFILQGALIWLIGLPLLAAQASPAPLGWLDGLALAAWAVGFYFEAVGDWQLAQFKRAPANKGKLLTSGLWAYTRHPNYFGDALQWWAFGLFALAGDAWWALLSPLLMSWLLRYVSGVAMLEKTLKKQKPGYAGYVRRTNAFIPWFPKSG